jgi:hypothetical protein
MQNQYECPTTAHLSLLCMTRSKLKAFAMIFLLLRILEYGEESGISPID